MPELFPSWKETREKLVAAGISEDAIDKGLMTIQQRAGPTAMSLDAQYFMAAKFIFKVDMPKVTSLKKGGGDGPGQRITCKDVTKALAVEATEQGTKFEIYGFVYNPKVGTTRKGKPQFTFTLFDHTGSIDVICYGKMVDHMEAQHLKNGDYIYIDHLQLEHREWTYERGPRAGQNGSAITCKIPPFEGVEPMKVQTPDGYGLESCFKDANSQLVQDGDMAYIRGFVVDDDQGDKEMGAKAWMSCTVSGRKVDKDSQACAAEHEGECIPVEKAFRQISVSPGGKLWTVSFSPENHPKERTLEGMAATFFCRYQKEFNKYDCLWYEVGTDRELPSAKDVLSYGQEEEEQPAKPLKKPETLKTPAPTAQPSGPALPGQKRLAVPAPTQVPPKFTKPVTKAKWHEVKENVEQMHDLIWDMNTSGRGADWPDIVQAAHEKWDLEEGQTEEAINALLDAGVIHEPILGRLKSTMDKKFSAPAPEAEPEPEAEDDGGVTTEQVVAELGIPEAGFNLTQLKKALTDNGYEEDTIQALLDDGVLVKKGIRYYAKGTAPENSPAAPTKPAPAPAPTPTPKAASKPSAGGSGKLPPTALPKAAQDVFQMFVGNFKQNPLKAVRRKLQEKLPDEDPDQLIKQAESDGWVTFDPEVAKAAGVNNPGGSEENPFIYWAVQ